MNNKNNMMIHLIIVIIFLINNKYNMKIKLKILKKFLI